MAASNTNLALWQAVEKTDPDQTKRITGKPYQGTSPKPYYLVHKATETFGPAGIGWGFTILSERVEDGAEGQKVHIAHVRVWYIWNEKRGEVEHIGQTMFAGRNKNGPFTDEDAPKKSVTDALVKALSMIGFAGDIFMGRYDDSKYVDELREEGRGLAANGHSRDPEPSNKPERTIPPPTKDSRSVYVDNAIERISQFQAVEELTDWLNVEGAKVWPDFGITQHDPDGSRIIMACKARRLALKQKAAA